MPGGINLKGWRLKNMYKYKVKDMRTKEKTIIYTYMGKKIKVTWVSCW